LTSTNKRVNWWKMRKADVYFDLIDEINEKWEDDYFDWIDEINAK
jgi:hypothetical protein